MEPMNQNALENQAKIGNPIQSPYFVPTPDLTQDEISERSFDLYRLFQISQVRESSLPQFDGMGYSRWNETNEMADISYIAPKKNKGDTRITSGITHEKDSTLTSFFLSLNFEGSVRIFYKDKELTDMGTTVTKIIRKTREEENYDGKRGSFYRNYVAQGTSFSREQYTEIWVPDKVISGEINPNRLDQVKWITKGYCKVTQGCESILVDGKKVFLEDIRQPDIQKQPGVYTVEYVPREYLRAIWGKTPRWANVPFIVTPTAISLGTLSQGSIYSDWIWGEIDFNKCELIHVYRPFEQRFQIYINGVPMLPSGFPLKAVSPSGLIPIAKGDGDIMNMFAYSKSIPSKTKIDQVVFDEILQNMVLKMRQSTFVPRSNMSDRIVTPDMFTGGRIISNLDPKDIPPLIENPGVTQFDMSFYELFSKHIDEKSLSDIIQGQAPNGMTLGQYMDQQKKAMLNVGLILDGLVEWERQMLQLRTLNIIAHLPYTLEDGSGYKEIPMEDTLFNGEKGLNVVKFEDNNIRSSEDVFQEELDYEKANGTNIAYTYIDPKLMKSMLDDPNYYFCYEVVPVDKNNDTLAQMMFIQMVTQAMNLFGPQSLQVDRIKKRYAQVFNEPFDNLFLSADEVKMNSMQAQQQLQQQDPNQQPGQPSNNQPGMPAPQNSNQGLPSPFADNLAATQSAFTK